MSTSCGWEGKGRYGSFRLRMNVWVCRQNCEIPREHVPYLSASAVVIHYEDALYQVYAPLPLPLYCSSSSSEDIGRARGPTARRAKGFEFIGLSVRWLKRTLQQCITRYLRDKRQWIPTDQSEHSWSWGVSDQTWPTARESDQPARTEPKCSARRFQISKMTRRCPETKAWTQSASEHQCVTLNSDGAKVRKKLQTGYDIPMSVVHLFHLLMALEWSTSVQ